MRALSIGAVFLMLALLPGVAAAQGFSFGFASGGGHHHGHHGHGCYGGNWYGFDFYQPPVYRYPAPLVYAPPPVTYIYPAPAVQIVQPAVIPVQPSPGPSAADTTTPNLSATPSSGSAVRLNALPTQQRASVILRNPMDNAGTVAFRVQDQVDAELNPGTTRTWNDRTSLTVEFDRGGDFGTTRKLLRPGSYEFVVTDNGWDLVATVAPTGNGRAATLQKNVLPSRR